MEFDVFPAATFYFSPNGKVPANSEMPRLLAFLLPPFTFPAQKIRQLSAFYKVCSSFLFS